MVDMHMANTLKTAVACALVSAAALAALPQSAHAQPGYDTTLAKAMADRAAARLGTLRDGFAMDETPVFVPGPDVMSDRIRETLEVEGMEVLTPVVDTTPTGSIPAAFVLPRTDVRVVYAG
jgi:hypothetical protein